MDNGHKPVPTTARLTLTMDLLTFAMTIDGDVPSLDCSIAMLSQAMREFEATQRMERVKAIQLAANNQAETQRIANALKGKL